MIFRAIVTSLCLVMSVGCKPIDQPLAPPPSTTRDLPATSRYGFELHVPIEFLNDGWDVYSWEAEGAERDRYRSVLLTPRFYLIVEAPLSEAGGTIPFRLGPTRDQPGHKRPILQLRVYDDVPSLTFSNLADTIRFVGHKVFDWDLNGSHIKEILHDRSSGYAHASAAIPALIARHSGFLYFFDFYAGLPEAETRSRQVVAGFRIVPAQ